MMRHWLYLLAILFLLSINAAAAQWRASGIPTYSSTAPAIALPSENGDAVYKIYCLNFQKGVSLTHRVEASALRKNKSYPTDIGVIVKTDGQSYPSEGHANLTDGFLNWTSTELPVESLRDGQVIDVEIPGFLNARFDLSGLDAALDRLRSECDPTYRPARVANMPRLPDDLPESEQAKVRGVFESGLTASNQFFFGGLTEQALKDCPNIVPKASSSRLRLWLSTIQAKLLAGLNAQSNYTAGLYAKQPFGCSSDLSAILLRIEEVLDDQEDRLATMDTDQWMRGCVRARNYSQKGCSCVLQVMSASDPDIYVKSYRYEAVKKQMSTSAGMSLLLCAMM